MNLWHSIFGGDETPGRYSAAIVDMAIERAVDGTDARLRLLSGYRKRLRPAVLQAIDQVVATVAAIPAAVPVDRRAHHAEPRLAARSPPPTTCWPRSTGTRR